MAPRGRQEAGLEADPTPTGEAWQPVRKGPKVP